jgi:hypothetical protein
MTALERLRRRLLGISEAEVSFERRGFVGTDRARDHLEGIGLSFLRGYHTALAHGQMSELGEVLEREPELSRGFSYEGAAMALAILDIVAGWGRWGGRLGAYLDGVGAHHVYMVHVGAGWAFGRLRLGHRRVLDQLDPLLRWLAFDGYGFHEGYFHWRTSIAGRRIPARLVGYERRAFTQGLGRSLWFVKACDVDRIASAIASFEPERRADLWSGIGLAVTYAGGAERRDVERLLGLAAGFEPHLAQGSAFAAKARQRAGNLTGAAGLACELLCGCPADEAAALTDTELLATESEWSAAGRDAAARSLGEAEPRYELWRRRIRERLGAGPDDAARAAV